MLPIIRFAAVLGCLLGLDLFHFNLLSSITGDWWKAVALGLLIIVVLLVGYALWCNHRLWSGYRSGEIAEGTARIPWREVPADIRHGVWLRAGGALIALAGIIYFVGGVLKPFTLLSLANTIDFHFSPQSKQYEKLTLRPTFESIAMSTGTFLKRPAEWELGLELEPKSGKPMTMTVKLPSLRASYWHPSFTNEQTFETLLDLDNLTEWMRKRCQVEMNEAALDEARQIMAMLKAFREKPPASFDEFNERIPLLMTGFTYAGFGGGGFSGVPAPFVNLSLPFAAALILILLFLLGLIDDWSQRLAQERMARAANALPQVRLRDLPPEIRSTAGLRFALAALAFITATSFVIWAAMSQPVTTRHTYNVILQPKTPIYRQIEMQFSFDTSEWRGNHYDVRAAKFPVALNLTLADGSKRDLAIEVPGLLTRYTPRNGGTPRSVILDIEELRNWMSTEAGLDVKSPDIEHQSAAIAALFKRQHYSAPDNIEVFQSRIRAMTDFTSTGWEPATSSNVAAALLPYGFAVLLVLVLYVLSFAWIKRTAVREAVRRGAVSAVNDPAPAGEPATAREMNPDAPGVLKFILFVLQTLSVFGIVFSSVGIAQVLAEMWRNNEAGGAMGSLWNDMLVFGTLAAASLFAVIMLSKAKREGRHRLARVVALLVIIICHLYAAVSQHWWHVPWTVGVFFAVIALVCYLVLRFGPDMPAAFVVLANAPKFVSSEPRLSRPALWGAVWAGIGVLSLVLLGAVIIQAHQSHQRLDEMHMTSTEIILASLFVALSSSAVIGTTIVGAVSIGQIKRSGGKLQGMSLAVADALCFPLLTLFVAVASCSGLWHSWGKFTGYGAIPALIVCFFIARAAWRAITGAKGKEKAAPDPQKQITRAAIGLLISGIANSIMLLSISTMWFPEASWSQHPFICTLVLSVFIIYAVLTVLVFRGALKMLNREDYAASQRAAIGAMLGFNIVSLPVGIWALVVLSKPEVKAEFGTTNKPADKNPFRWETWWFSRSPRMQKLMCALLSAVLVLSLIAFFSFSMKQSTTQDRDGMKRDLYDVTVGAGDPWLYSYLRSGFGARSESGVNLVTGSTLFGIAALLAGMALTRLSHEQKRRRALADVSADTPQRRFFWSAVAGGAFFAAGVAGLVVHVIKEETGPKLVDANILNPNFTRRGITSIRLRDGVVDEMKLTQQQAEQINRTLSSAYVEFLKLENANSLFRSEQGHLVKIITPFHDKSFALADKLSADLRAIAGREIISAPERGAVWKLRLLRHAGEFNVRAELWQEGTKYHRKEVWEKDGEKITSTSADGFDSMNIAFGHDDTLAWNSMKDILHESKPDDATTGHTIGWDVLEYWIKNQRHAEMMLMLGGGTVKQDSPPDEFHKQRVTQATTPLGRACAETQLKLLGTPLPKEATPEDLVKKLEELMGEQPRSDKIPMKLFPETWWLARLVLLRKIIKVVLTLLAMYCAFEFFGFGFHCDSKGDGSGRIEHNAFSIGTPEPWYQWEKTTEQITTKTGGSSSMHSSSGFHLFTQSFGAGILCLLISMLLFRIGRCEKAAQAAHT